MLTLYYHPICPLSRQVRLYLKELDLEFGMIKEEYWNRRKEFIDINPAGTLPILNLDSSDINIIGIYPITEYIAESNENFYLMPSDLLHKREIRKYLAWFNDKFYREVSKVFVDEKIIRLMMKKGPPRTEYIKAARNNLINHLKFLSAGLEPEGYLVAAKLSCADLAAAAHISVLDYFGEVTWDIWPIIKDWYSIIKSRPSFRPILNDYIPGFSPPKFYTELDF